MKIFLFVAIQFMAIVVIVAYTNQQNGFSDDSQRLKTSKNYVDSVSKPKINVAFSLQNKHLTVGEPIILILEVTNNSDEPISVHLGVNRRTGFALEIRKSDSTILKGKHPPEPDFGSTGVIRVDPLRTFNYTVLVSEWFPPLSPGEYTLLVGLKHPVVTQGSKKTSNTGISALQLSIGGKDTGRLASMAEQLLGTILTNDRLDDRWFAARSLTYVQDPLVIPFIERALLSNRSVEQVLVDTLVEQASEDAVNILIGLATKMTDRKSLLMVEFALETLERQLQDARLKEKIKSTLILHKRPN
jgi:hypothetical protein